MTNKKTQVEEKVNNQIPISVGNTEVLKVKILAEINEQLKRIANALEK
jgi:RNA-binding protein YhbY